MSNILTDASRTIIKPLFTQAKQMIALSQVLQKRGFFKQTVYKNDNYLDFIRQKPCIACGYKGPTMAHHEGFGLKAMGSKKTIPDTYTVPLCPICHAKRHGEGYHTFWKRVNIDLRLVIINQITEYLLNEQLSLKA